MADADPGWMNSMSYVCPCMALCQCWVIAMNMSIAALANQVAQGNYDLTQALVLAKLVADFVGRSAFFLVPRPKQSSQSVNRHALLVWLLEIARWPLWLAVYLRSTREAWRLWTGFLESREVLLWLIWVPLISLGAFSSSWCSVIAITAATEKERTSVNLIMSFAIYAGFSVGLLIALLS
eukprot:gnl/TRDRNA2_/TRDRNA2_165322_c0_seq4.p1 gnl/TRDRNA2_/TRDRNA2_165322_c0~~gnl/TRDRNA2_/TRDRNA2_165322_c0_seq4.p1  ORF type:complete len:198 (-),score=15.91 gnl/TRDRNA2_/TRDRNA2_165322_c0_seq4:247-786(-)